MARKYEPHPYQVRGFEAGKRLSSFYVPWPMGAGKTVFALTYAEHMLVQEFAANRALVVAPLKTAETGWDHECWDHLRHLTVAKALGSTRSRLEALESGSDIVVINRDNLIWLVKHYGKRWPFDLVVIDENWGIRDQSKTWKALKSVRKYINRFVIMCGTPRPKSVEELWPQMYLIDGGRALGKTLTEFRHNYMQPDKRNAHQIYTWKPKAGAEEKINELVAPYMLSLLDGEYPYKPDPEPIEVKVNVPLDEYRELERELVLGDVVAQTAAVLYGKLRQMASGRVYDVDRGLVHIHSEKLKALDEILEKADGPVLLFYHWKHTLDAIVDRVKGVTTSLDVEAWNRGDIGLMALHPASAGHGVDGLQHGGSIIVWLDLPDDLGLWQQANARLDRQGQTKPVRIYTIVAAGTVDEDVVDGLRRKEIGQDRLLAAIKERNAAWVAEQTA